MVLPFELYCSECGSEIASFTPKPDSSELLSVLQEEMSVDSWLSEKLQGRLKRCPNCGRQLQSSPLVRADVVFGEWADDAELSKRIIFYV